MHDERQTPDSRAARALMPVLRHSGGDAAQC